MIDCEKPMVFRATRLRRVRQVSCWRSIVCVLRTDCMGLQTHMPLRHAGGIGVQSSAPTGPEPWLPRSAYVILTDAAHLCQDDPLLMINGMPYPSLLRFSVHHTPHVIEL
jgi:hypothetical protein